MIANAYFYRDEFSCRCGYCRCDTVDAELLQALTKLRREFGPVTIISGQRCPEHNTAVGGAINSQHLLGKAADIVVRGIKPVLVQQRLDSLYPNQYGIGSYNSFTHIDVREIRARWKG